MHEGVTLRSPEDVDSYLNRLFLRSSIRAAFAKKLGDSASPELLDLAAKFESTEKDLVEMREHDALRERLHADVAAYETAVEKVRANTGIDETDEAATRALEARDDLSDAVFEATPTTLAGAAALVEFARCEDLFYSDAEPATKALATLARFLSRVA
jgi:arginine utilization protein RocB